ncbi:3-hydroxyacyl-CoA dehydrogenase NAD-binding domain-containing protein [Aestuariivirga litoralis]|uniref:3-hydroxyacyl-CoA dehydrogenase NAD-binding domain-containing protein n=1 Tax=Aestuariivirga litoralis TaxID=2650924 RepID=UPI0018C648E0|nr:3-hydroxyacyl-CoA dehydrogenase NAD-binding domain-containing protein [Aestuariivirga litoralis]MBG1231268.1 L-carnitine dehydrogenase [Aestuariivirga litoralis]
MTIKTIGIAGTGLIGAGWAARAMHRGIDVIAYDVSPAAEAKLKAAIKTAWPSLDALRGKSKNKGKLTFTTDLAKMASKAEFIHEAAPEREELKIKLFRDLDAIAAPNVVLSSSSSGFLPSNLQSQCIKHPERVVIGHPFNPVYLLPLVELVPGNKTDAASLDRADAYFQQVGMQVLRLKKEIDGYICDRLQEALWREALHILDKDIGTTGDIDDSIVYSAGMRWAFMGSFMTYHVGGGPGGMRDFMKQFDPTLELPWTDLKFPKWNDALEKRLIDGTDAQAAGRSVAQIEAKRNAILVDMMKLFKKHKIGSGLSLEREEKATKKKKPAKKSDKKSNKKKKKK